MMYGVGPNAATGGDLGDESNSEFYTGLNNAPGATRQRFPGLYVGNLTWWTTDQDVINAINSVGINDVQEVKFFENRNNGQSKGFCVVTFTSESSLSIVMEKLPKLELYGQNPVVTPYNRQNLNLFESQTKTRPQINSNNGPNSHAAGIMGISSISGVHAGTQGLPYSGLNSFNPGSGGIGGSVGGPRAPSYHTNMRLQMRAPRPVMRGSVPGAMGNGPMMPGAHQMNRMRFIQPQAWNNSQGGGGYNPTPRMPQVNMDISSRLGGISSKPDDSSVGHDMMSGLGSQSSYYNPHHQSSQSDHYRGDPRDHRDLRDDRERDRDRERERDRDSSRRLEERPIRQDDRSLRHEDSRSIRHDERSLKLDDRSARREERSSRREEGSSSSRRVEESSSSRREDRSSRREEKSSRREKSHRSTERTRSRSRDRSRERKDRRDRRERY